MQLTLKTITPIHIGNGEKLFPLDYVAHGGRYYHIGQRALLDFLETVPDGPNLFTNWVLERQKKIEEWIIKRKQEEKKGDEANDEAIKDFNQQKAHLEKSFHLLEFAKEMNVTESLIPLLETHTHVRRGNINGQVEGQVAGMLCSGKSEPYLPGSSLKGALRTALLYYYLTHKADRDHIFKMVRKELNFAQQKIEEARVSAKNDYDRKKKMKSTITRFKKQFAAKIEQEAFYCGIQKQKKRPIIENDVQMDLMKLVRVTDGIVKNPGSAFGVEDMKLYLVKEVQEGLMEAQEQGQTTFVEVIPAEQVIESAIDFDVLFLAGYKNSIEKKDYLIVNGLPKWIGIREKVRDLFRIDIGKLPPADDERALAARQRKVVRHLVDCMATFSKRQIENDRQWLERFQLQDHENRYTTLLSAGLDKVGERLVSPLIHVGFGTGFPGVTALLYFLEDHDGQELFHAIRETFQLGKLSKNQVAGPITEFPKSRRWARNTEEIQPLGFLEVERIR